MQALKQTNRHFIDGGVTGEDKEAWRKMQSWISMITQRLCGRSHNSYRERAQKSKDTSKLVFGEPSDRLYGLSTLLQKVEGASLFDVGCHDGTVAFSFYNNGCKFIDGIDLSRAAINIANKKFSNTDADAKFSVADLAKGVGSIEDSMRRSSYTVVCYLGVHHHLAKQMDHNNLNELLIRILKMTEQYLAVRAPKSYLDKIIDTAREMGFSVLEFTPDGVASPIVILERTRAA